MTEPIEKPQAASQKPPSRRRRVLFRLVLALAILVVVACVAAQQAGFGCIMFHGEDQPGPAAAVPPTQPAADPLAPAVDLMVGQWEGTWSNTSDSMGGRLTCSITPLDGDRYEAKFDAVFANILTFDSKVTLTVKREGDTWKFHGEKDLGFPLGVYTYDGHTDGREFYSTYDSSGNKGSYRMTRRGPTSQPASG
jgi:hypothetical protein